MKLPIPVISGKNVVYRDVELDSPSGGLIANTQNILENVGNSYTALQTWVSGCVTSIGSEENEVTGKQEIKSMIRKMAYKSVELIAIKSILTINDDDEIEGIYECPRCGMEIIAERKMEDGEEISNTADYVSDMEIKYIEDDTVTFSHDLEIPVEFEQGLPGSDGGHPIETVESITFHYPTLGDCIDSFSETGKTDKTRLQYRIYSKAIEEINGNKVDKKWKRRFGVPMFNKMKGIKSDLIAIFNMGNEYGLNQEVEKRCPKCGKLWKEPVNTMNFFASALRSIS